MRQFLAEVSDAYGIEIDPDDPEEALARLGSISRMIGAALRNTANPTMLDAGYKTNVIPGTASATIDGRFLYGQEAEFEEQLDELSARASPASGRSTTRPSRRRSTGRRST